MRRKIVRKTKASTAQDDKKLQGALKKLNVQPIPGVEEVNMFREDGNVLHFSTPKGTSRVRVYPAISPHPLSLSLLYPQYVRLRALAPLSVCPLRQHYISLCADPCMQFHPRRLRV